MKNKGIKLDAIYLEDFGYIVVPNNNTRTEVIDTIDHVKSSFDNYKEVLFTLFDGFILSEYSEDSNYVFNEELNEYQVVNYNSCISCYPS